jgi:hypothetical protein
MSFSLRATAPALVALAMVAGCQGGSGVTVHADGDELPMALQTGGGSFTSSAHGREPGGTWTTTFGQFLPCVAHGPSPLVINGTDWVSDEGLDPLSVRVFVRTFDDSESDPIGSMIGTPLDDDNSDLLSGSLHEGVEGFEVKRSCADGPGKGHRDEILVTVKADDGGAHVGDFTVRYTTPDGRKYAVVSDWTMQICGTEAPKDDCDGNAES